MDHLSQLEAQLQQVSDEVVSLQGLFGQARPGWRRQALLDRLKAKLETQLALIRQVNVERELQNRNLELGFELFERRERIRAVLRSREQ